MLDGMKKVNKARLERTLVALSAITTDFAEKGADEAEDTYKKCNRDESGNQLEDLPVKGADKAEDTYKKCNRDESGNQLEDLPVRQQWKSIKSSLEKKEEQLVDGAYRLIDGKFAIKEGRQLWKIVLAVEDYYYEFSRVYHTFYKNDSDCLTLTQQNRRKRVTAVGQEIAKTYYINQAIFTDFLKSKPSLAPTVIAEDENWVLVIYGTCFAPPCPFMRMTSFLIQNPDEPKPKSKDAYACW